MVNGAIARFEFEPYDVIIAAILIDIGYLGKVFGVGLFWVKANG